VRSVLQSSSPEALHLFTLSDVFLRFNFFCWRKLKRTGCEEAANFYKALVVIVIFIIIASSMSEISSAVKFT
jgi:hypothetical protein